MLLEDIEGRQHEFFVDHGFAQVRENALTVVAEECTPIAQLDAEAAWQDILRARQMPTRTDAELDRRAEALATAQAKFNLAQSLRRRRGLVREGALDEE